MGGCGGFMGECFELGEADEGWGRLRVVGLRL